MNKKKLLFVSPRFLFPSDSGGKIRTRDVLRGLKGGKFEITLASPADADAVERHADDLGRVCDRFVTWPATGRGSAFQINRWLALASKLPVPVATDRSAAGRATIEREIQAGYDLVVADFPHSTVLLPAEVAAPVLLFTHNVEAEIFRRHASVATNPAKKAVWASQARKMADFEDDAARRADGVVVVSERDGKHFRAVSRADRVFLIPTGVDLEFFHYVERGATPPATAGRVVFTGSMDWAANVDGIRYFMDEVWPRVVAVRPDASMVVVGHSPPKAFEQAVAERKIAWTFTGFVDDVRPPVAEADVYVIPLRVGGGTRIKAFEAMSMGCPVVSTSIGIEGLPVVPGRDFLAGDTAETFANAILEVLGNDALRRSLSRNARDLVERRFSHHAAAAVFEEACLATAAVREAPVARRSLPAYGT